MIKARDLEIGQELYKVRHGKNIGYYKIVITKRWKNKANRISYRYIIKGKGKKKNEKNLTDSFRILAYKYLFYDNKEDMLVDFLTMNSFIREGYSPMIREEIEKIRKKDEYFI